MKREFMKKASSLLLTAVMVSTATMPAMAVDVTEDTVTNVWTLGKETNVNGPQDGVQGTNGWYFMYSNDIDVAEGTNYNVSKFKECTWADKGSMQLVSEGGTYEYMWMPENYLKEGLTGEALYQPDANNPDATFNNWVMTSNGTLNTDVETTAVTGIYVWEAPADGTYNYDVNYAAGGNHCDLGGTRYYYCNDYYIKDGTPDKMTPEQREGGVALSVNTKDEKKDYVQCIAMTPEHDYLYNGTFTGSVELKAGERIYFVVDPREVGAYDRANFEITVTEGTCDWGEAVYTWDENNVCTATRECAAHKGHTSSVSAEGTLIENDSYKAPTCSEEGQGLFRAEFEEEGLEAQEAVRPILKLGHNTDNFWADATETGKAVFEWADDYSYCVWKTPCANCGELVEMETSTKIYAEPGTATCTEGGTVVYKASFYWEWVWNATDEIEISEGLGHDYSNIYNARYEWSEDKTQCTKYYICSRCDEEKSETVDATITAPKCTEDGEAAASFDGGWDVQKEVLPMTGHTFKTEWTTDKAATTSEDGVKSRECEACGKVEEKIAQIDGTTLSFEKKTYTGKTLKAPTVTVKDSEGNKLVEGTDYTVSGNESQKKIGEYKITVTFTGNYAGTETLTYAIVPGAPSSASANLYGYDDVKLSWKKVTGATGYNVYYKKATASKYTYLTRTTGTSVKKANLSDGVKYTFKVVPYFTAGKTRYEALNSKTSSVYTLKKVATPTVKKNGSKVKVSWKNIEGESGYQISASAKKSGTNVVATYSTTKGTSKTVSATKGKTYYYKVRAYKVVDGKKIFAPWSSVKAYKR